MALANYVPQRGLQGSGRPSHKLPWQWLFNDVNGGGKSWVSDAPSMNLPTDTDCKAVKESKEPIRSEEGVDGQMSPGDKVERCTPTDADTLETGRPLWKSQKG